MRHLFLVLCLLFISSLGFANTGHEDHPHFVEPLTGEHAFLETKAVFDYVYQNRADFERPDGEDIANLSSYEVEFEWRANETLGLFTAARLIHANPAELSETTGLGDIEFGSKWAFYQNDKHDLITTLLFAMEAPTGNEAHGLGERRTGLETAILFWKGFGKFSLQGSYALEISLGSGAEETVFEYRHSLAYQLLEFENEALKSIHPIIEAGGDVPLRGESKGQHELSLTLGLRVELFADTNLGLGFNFPVGGRESEKSAFILNINKHF